MVKFFNKIRQHSLTENKFTKYLMYAFGEIILVVIGILIALQINNWNEQRKQAKNYINILKTIKNDMVADTTKIGQILEYYKEVEPAFLLSKNDTISKAEYLKCKSCPLILASFKPMYLQTVGYNRMQAINLDDDMGKDSLNIKLTIFYSVFTPFVEKAVNVITDVLSENTDTFRDTQPWFKDWYENKYTDEFYNFVMYDPIYKNRVAQYYLYIYKFYLEILTGEKQHEEELLKLIEVKIEAESDR